MQQQLIRPRRSLIFMPGNKPEMFQKAAKSGADIVCIDLEDAIAAQDKADARAKTLALGDVLHETDGPECIVRLNCLRTADGLADLLAMTEVDRCPPAIMLAKVKSPDEIHVYEELLSGAHEHVRFHVIIETNQGLQSCYEIAQSSSRIDSLLFGGVDMAAELRIEPNWNELIYARSRVIHAAAGADLDVIDVPYMDLDDMDGLAQEVAACKRLGFTGKASIHPKQIGVINDTFSPSQAEIDQARRIIAEFEKQGTGLVVIDNKLIEKPVLRSMYRILEIAENHL